MVKVLNDQHCFMKQRKVHCSKVQKDKSLLHLSTYLNLLASKVLAHQKLYQGCKQPKAANF